MFRKKKKPLFGANIQPDCSYCENNIGTETVPVCALRCKMSDGICKKSVMILLCASQKPPRLYAPDNIRQMISSSEETECLKPPP